MSRQKMDTGKKISDDRDYTASANSSKVTLL